MLLVPNKPPPPDGAGGFGLDPNRPPPAGAWDVVDVWPKSDVPELAGAAGWPKEKVGFWGLAIVLAQYKCLLLYS